MSVVEVPATAQAHGRRSVNMAQQSQQGAQPLQNLTRGRGAHRPDRQANINSAWTYDVSSGQSTGTDPACAAGEGGAAGAVPSAAAPTAARRQDRTSRAGRRMTTKSICTGTRPGCSGRRIAAPRLARRPGDGSDVQTQPHEKGNRHDANCSRPAGSGHERQLRRVHARHRPPLPRVRSGRLAF